MKIDHVDIRSSHETGEAWSFFCQRLFDAAIGAVDPATCMPAYLPKLDGFSSVHVLAVGKDAASMASTLEAVWSSVSMSGLVICPYGKGYASSVFDVVEAAHPVPNEDSVAAAKRAIDLACAVPEGGLLLILLSGGGSALMAMPAPGLSLAGKQQVINRLLTAGATIHELNTVRRALSAIKGGKLLMAAVKAKQVMTLAVSDVVGDDPQVIASGPTVPGRPDEQDRARAVLDKYAIKLPAVFVWPRQDMPDMQPDTAYHVIASSTQMLAAAGRFLAREGLHVIDLGSDVEGEARLVAKDHAARIIAHCNAQDAPVPTAFISGGELTVTVRGKGLGGPNQEYALALKAALPVGAFYIFAADTDGVDGQGGAGGAMVDPQSYQAAKTQGLAIESYLLNNDSFNYFNHINGLFKPKNNSLNVNDLRVVCRIPAGL